MPRKPRPSAPRDVPAPATSARIFSAAESLLSERGYDGVSVQDVADRAGINKALVFYHFGNKDKLMDAVLERYYAAHESALASAAAGAPPTATAADRMHRLIDAYFDFIAGNSAYPRLVQLELARGGGNLDRIRDSIALLFEGLRRALDGVVPASGPLAPKHFFLSFSGMVINYFTYAPVLDSFWREHPLSETAFAERRRHLHWMVDAVLAKLAAGGAP